MNKKKVCGLCKNTYEKFHHSRKYCSSCLDKILSAGGGRDQTREKVRIKYNHTCQICFEKWIEGERRFDVHHLYGDCGKKSRSYDPVSTMKNLLVVCHRCHMNLEKVKRKMRDHSSSRNKIPNKIINKNQHVTICHKKKSS
jgi:protein-arginine kinase activator protein McsA